MPWRILTKQGLQALGRLVKKEPFSGVKKRASEQEFGALFQKENDLYKQSQKIHGEKLLPAGEPVNSWEVQCFFRNMGKDTLEVAPGETPRSYRNLRGRPRFLSVWVYGRNKRHNLYALLSNSTGNIYPVSLGNLRFSGWRRLEVVIPAYVQKRTPSEGRHFNFSFLGFKIASHASEEPGLFLFMFDQVGVLIDHGDSRYPGAEQPDDWK